MASRVVALTRASRVIRAWVVLLAVIAVACDSTVPQPTPTPIPSATLAPPSSQAVPTTTPAVTPSVPPTPPPKVVGDLAIEQCDPEGVLQCEHQAVVITESIAASGVALTYSTEWADGRTDRPNWNADALGLGGWALDVLQRYDPEHGILLSGDGSWRIAAAADIGDGELAVPTYDGRRYFIFDNAWRHKRTVDVTTGTTLVTFEYDDVGRLARALGSIDGRHVDLTVERLDAGGPAALLGLDGVRTPLATGPDGELSLILRVDGTSLDIGSADFGLIQSAQETSRGATTFEYDSSGRLTKGTDADGVSVTLSFDDSDGAVTVATTYVASGTARLRAERDGEGILRTLTDTDGTSTVLVMNQDGSMLLTEPNGTITSIGAQPHPRWGLAAPVRTPFVETRPDGREYRVEMTTTLGTESVEPAGAAWQAEYVINGLRYREAYEPASRTLTQIDPADRETILVLDVQARLVEYRAPDPRPRRTPTTRRDG